MERDPITVQHRGHARMNIEAGAADIVWTDGNPTAGHKFALSGRELLLVRNVAATPQWVRIIGGSDSFGRSGTSGDYDVAAGGMAAFAVSPVEVWAQAGQWAFVDVESADVKLAVVRYP